MKKTLKVIGNVVIWVVFAFALLMTIFALAAQKSSDGIPKIFGKMPVTILSDSMNPTFKEGDLIIDQALTAAEKSELKVGDVITFYSDINDDGIDEMNSHRIVSLREDNGIVYYTTQGDNTETNFAADPYEISASSIIGQYTGTKIAKLGGIINYLKSPDGFLFCVVIPLILFFMFELYRFIAVLVSMKSRKTTAEQEEEIKRSAVEEYLKQQELNANVGSDDAGASSDCPDADSPSAAESSEKSDS